MTNKEIVKDLLQQMPEDASLLDIAEKIEFIAGVRQGVAELDRGERIPIDEIERELPSWIATSRYVSEGSDISGRRSPARQSIKSSALTGLFK